MWSMRQRPRATGSIPHRNLGGPPLWSAHDRRSPEFRAAPAHQGRRALAPWRLLLQPARRASFLGRRSRRLLGRDQLSGNARDRVFAGPSRSALVACAQNKPLSVGIVLLDLVPAGQHQPDLFAADNRRRHKLSPLVDRINDRYGRCTIGFGLLPPEVRVFKGHAAFRRVPKSWEFCECVCPAPLTSAPPYVTFPKPKM
jgi:hypothetical protein